MYTEDWTKWKLNPKGNQPWIFLGRANVEAEAPIFWPPDVKSQFIRKDPDVGKHWGQEEKGEQDEMVGCHHRLSGHIDWANSGRQWRTGRPAILQFMGSQRVRHDCVTGQQQGEDDDIFKPRKSNMDGPREYHTKWNTVRHRKADIT